MQRQQTALVTGGAVRIGRAVCEALADSGINVLIHCRRSVDEAGKLADALRDRGVQADVVQADLARTEEAEALIDRAVSAAGDIDFLINNAAVFNKMPLAEITPEVLNAEFMPNLYAPVLLTKAFAARSPQGGAVVNFLDRRITGDDPDCIPYLLSKKALHAFTRAAALELAPDIRVNAVAPGAILPPPGEGNNYLKERAGPIPLDIQCTPQDIAEAVMYLIRARTVTGQVLYIDGGQHLL